MKDFELTVTLPASVTDPEGIDEDTMFESYFEDGAIHIRRIDDSEITPEPDCIGCPFFCEEHEICILD